VSAWLYFGLWLVAALVALAFVSAAIAKRLRLREVRRQQGVLLLDALDRYGEWVAAQRHAPVFDGESAEAAAALDQAGLIRSGWFPELATDMAELLGVHARLLHFLAAQHELRQRDPDAWIETDHDGRFLALWRQQLAVLQTMQARLADLGIVSPMPQWPVQPAGDASDIRESRA
jgi:hypothetical protein